MAKYYLSAFADEAGKDLDVQIAALKRNRIRFIELRGLATGPIDAQSDTTAKEVKAKLDANGIGISALGSRLGKTDITASFDHSLESLRRLCEICHILGAERIRMFSYFIPEGENPRDYREEVMARLQKLCDYAKTQNIRLMHENEARIYGEKMEEVIDIHESVSDLGGIFDPSNYRMADVDQALTIQKHMPYVQYLHIKDCTKEHVIVPAGYGDGMIAEAINHHDSLFAGDSFLTLEPHLKKFQGYGDIDKHELKTKFSFKDSNESFDFAVKSLKEVLMKNGFKESEDMAWSK
ncbi:MAG: sugar phosphate isomerase/epimerase [Ruminococcaceae bacterium]|nr:sugar phosphate isomerase/epimerase [Oscillospiraceae bacterium]